jgi:hypothetical protein
MTISDIGYTGAKIEDNVHVYLFSYIYLSILLLAEYSLALYFYSYSRSHLVTILHKMDLILLFDLAPPLLVSIPTIDLRDVDPRLKRLSYW